MRVLCISLFSLLLWSCDKVFEYSPFDVNSRSLHINVANSRTISDNLQSTYDTIKLILISDTHEEHDDLADAIKSINKQKDVDFVLCCGDITTSGLIQEYEWYIDQISKIKIPVITVIGNHDQLANGKAVYERLFGKTDFSFSAGVYKFIIFNDVLWENNNTSPRYEWLRDELSDNGKFNILAAHLPPYTGELPDIHRLVYNQIVDSSHVMLTLHGQFHFFSEREYNGIRTVVSPAIDKREYCLIKIHDQKAEINIIKF